VRDVDRCEVHQDRHQDEDRRHLEHQHLGHRGVRRQDHQHPGHQDEEQNQVEHLGHLGHRDEGHLGHPDEDHLGHHVGHQGQDDYQDRDVRQDRHGNRLGHLDDCQVLPGHLVVAGWGDQMQTLGLEVVGLDEHRALRLDHEGACQEAFRVAFLEEAESTVQAEPMASD
jgi:hypothetical protein